MRDFLAFRDLRLSRLGAMGSGAPPLIDVTGPVVTDVVYIPGSPSTLSFTVDEDCTMYFLHNASATPLTGPAIKAGAEVTQALAAGYGYPAIDDAAWGAGTWYLHFAFEDAALNTTTITPIQHDIAAPGFVEDWSDYANGNTFTELDAAYWRNASNANPAIITDLSAPAGLACSLITGTANERWIERDDITTALSYRTTEDVSIKALVRLPSLNVARAVIGFIDHTTELGTGVSFGRITGVNTWKIGAMAIGNVSTRSNTNDAMSGVADGTLIRVEVLISGKDVKIKAYADGGSIPGTYTTQSDASDLVFTNVGLCARVIGGSNLDVLGYNVAIGSTAPEV